MDVVVQAIAALAMYPIQTVIVLAAVVIFILWFVKYRPEEVKQKREQQKEHNKIMQDYMNIISEYKVELVHINNSYDKLTDYSTKVVENNTVVLQSILNSLDMLLKETSEENKQSAAAGAIHKAHDKEVLEKLQDIEIALVKLLERNP